MLQIITMTTSFERRNKAELRKTCNVTEIYQMFFMFFLFCFLFFTALWDLGY